jgi:hypothetical protein
MMILPKAVKDQAQAAEKYINDEREFVDKMHKHLSSYLDKLSAGIQPIINNINTGLKKEGLPFEYALEAMKDRWYMTNSRIKDKGYYIKYSLWESPSPGPLGFYLYVHDSDIPPAEWTPTTKDLLAEDWCHWIEPEEEWEED